MTFKEHLKTYPEWVATLVVMMIITFVCVVAIILSLTIGTAWVIAAAIFFLIFMTSLLIVRSIRRG
jgi:hypothetical protein